MTDFEKEFLRLQNLDGEGKIKLPDFTQSYKVVAQFWFEVGQKFREKRSAKTAKK
jgi:hypothetical protein